MMTNPWQRYRYEAVVVSVYDGDTVTLEIDLGFSTKRVERCRLSRINAPEIRGDERAKGILSHDYLKSLLPVGSVVYVQTIRDAREKYGRYLAEIHIKDGCVNDLMVKAGHAEYREY